MATVIIILRQMMPMIQNRVMARSMMIRVMVVVTRTRTMTMKATTTMVVRMPKFFWQFNSKRAIRYLDLRPL